MCDTHFLSCPGILINLPDLRAKLWNRWSQPSHLAEREKQRKFANISNNPANCYHVMVSKCICICSFFHIPPARIEVSTVKNNQKGTLDLVQSEFLLKQWVGFDNTPADASFPIYAIYEDSCPGHGPLAPSGQLPWRCQWCSLSESHVAISFLFSFL